MGLKHNISGTLTIDEDGDIRFEDNMGECHLRIQELPPVPTDRTQLGALVINHRTGYAAWEIGKPITARRR